MRERLIDILNSIQENRNFKKEEMNRGNSTRL